VITSTASGDACVPQLRLDSLLQLVAAMTQLDLSLFEDASAGLRLIFPVRSA
jgi:hypothetical protein